MYSGREWVFLRLRPEELESNPVVQHPRQDTCVLRLVEGTGHKWLRSSGTGSTFLVFQRSVTVTGDPRCQWGLLILTGPVLGS